MEKEIHLGNLKNETFEVDCFLATNNKLLKDQKDLAGYDEFLKTEKEKLRKNRKN